MRHKRTGFGPLLTAFDSKARPARRCRKEIAADVRLPSRKWLVEIDKRAEAAAAAEILKRRN